MESFAVRFVVLVFAGAAVGLVVGLLLSWLDVIENPFWPVAAGIAVAAGLLVWMQLSRDAT